MTVLITLTAAGTDTGPFALYSNLDGYTTPFEVGVSKGSLLGGHTSTIVPDYTTVIRVKSSGACINFEDITVVYPTTTTTTTTTPIVDYCVYFKANNNDNIKMSLEGYIDFTAELAGRSISTGASTGTITSYVINGTTVFCSIAMTFTSTKAIFNESSLPYVLNKVLTGIVYTVEIICTNATEINIYESANYAVEEPGVQLEAIYDNCMLGKARNITIGTYSCISGICSLVGNTVIQVYTLSQGTYIQEGEIIYSDVNLTTPYLASSAFKAPHSVGYTGVFSVNQTTGEIEVICMLGDGC